MSLDNTLAVAGVGRGHPGLIIVGLLFSVCVIMTSSLFIAALMNRYPFLVILGAGVLSWTASRMILADAAIHKVVGVLFRTDLTDGPMGVLLSVGITVVVVAISSWRKWSRRTPIGLNEQTIMLSTPRDLNHYSSSPSS